MSAGIAGTLRAVLRGNVNGVTIWRAGSLGWQASVRVDGGWLVEIDRNPDVALAGALERAGRMTAAQGAPEAGPQAPTKPRVVMESDPRPTSTTTRPRAILHPPAPDPKKGGLFD